MPFEAVEVLERLMLKQKRVVELSHSSLCATMAASMTKEGPVEATSSATGPTLRHKRASSYFLFAVIFISFHYIKVTESILRSMRVES